MVGGHPAIDLVNTVEPRLPVAGRHDHLGMPDDLLTWARRADLVDEREAAEIARAWREAPQAAGSALASVIQIREALFTALAAGLGPDYAQPGTGPRPAPTRPSTTCPCAGVRPWPGPA